MTIIAASDLIHDLSHVLQALQTGQEFLVTDAARAVARILPATPAEAGQVLTGEAWQRAFDEMCRRAQLRSDRYPRGFVVDDSRDAIYGERENAQL